MVSRLRKGLLWRRSRLMKKVFLLILFSNLILSCSGKTQSFIDDIWDNFSFNSTL